MDNTIHQEIFHRRIWVSGSSPAGDWWLQSRALGPFHFILNFDSLISTFICCSKAKYLYFLLSNTVYILFCLNFSQFLLKNIILDAFICLGFTSSLLLESVEAVCVLNMRELLREWERESSQMSWARLWAKEFSSWQLRGKHRSIPTSEGSSYRTQGGSVPCPGLIGDNASLLLFSSPSASQHAYWTHLEHDSGQVPNVASNSGVHRAGSVLCPWKEDCTGLLVWSSWSLTSSSILPYRLPELGKLIGGPWARDPSQMVACWVCSHVVLVTLLQFSVPIEITVCPPLFTFFQV